MPGGNLVLLVGTLRFTQQERVLAISSRAMPRDAFTRTTSPFL